VFEHHYDTNFAHQPGIATHYVAPAYRIDVSAPPSPPEVQHSRYAWFSKDEARPEPARSSIHPNTAVYFELV
jgi:colanic acid biosynthesis protein WcaH